MDVGFEGGGHIKVDDSCHVLEVYAPRDAKLRVLASVGGKEGSGEVGNLPGRNPPPQINPNSPRTHLSALGPLQAFLRVRAWAWLFTVSSSSVAIR